MPRIDLEFPRLTLEQVASALHIRKDLLDEIEGDLVDWIQQTHQVLHLEACWVESIIEQINGDEIKLGNGISFQGNGLNLFSTSSHILVCGITLGLAISALTQERFSRDSQVEALMIDAIANVFMNESLQRFTQTLKREMPTKGFTRRMEFGNNQLSLDQMKKAVGLLGETIEIDSNDVLSPKKSLVFLVGVGDQPDCLDQGLECSTCEAKSCSFRSDERKRVRIHQKHGIDVMEAKKESKLFDVLREGGFPIPGDCMGNGTCGKCKARIENADPPTEEERRVLSESEIDNNIRLSCMVFLNHDIDLWLMDVEEIDVLADYDDPIVLLPDSYDANHQTIHGMKQSLKEKNRAVGFAVDLGTTTCAVLLVDMIQGTVLDKASFVNGQHPYGTDVMTRIEYASRSASHLKHLQKITIEQINKSMKEVLKKNGFDSEDVVASVIVGNTVMQHLLLGVDVSSLGEHPYEPLQKDETIVQGEKIGLPLAGTVFIPPVFSGFIGGDIISGLVFLQKLNKPYLFIDLGTNGEVALVKEFEIFVASAAAGPAFEAGGIEFGIPATSKAITKVRLEKDAIYISCQDELPEGICGSGILTLVGELLREGLLDEQGGWSERALSHKRYNQGRFYLTDALYVTQKDIRLVQLAKAAVRAAIRVLLMEGNIEEEALKIIVFGGAFGNTVEPDSIQHIGLIGKNQIEKTVFKGNTALAGARTLLLQKTAWLEACRMPLKASTVILGGNRRFEESFIDEMKFLLAKE